MNMFE
jgi:hypothetical protein